MADNVEVSNLGTTGKKSGHRYHKFTKAKDLSKASAKDMEVKLLSFLIKISYFAHRKFYREFSEGHL